MSLEEASSLNRLTDAVEKLIARQESLLRNQAQITENHDLLAQNQTRGVENHDIVIRNQATIIKNQSIITQNQASIMRNQELLIVNQSHLKTMLEMQMRVLAAVTGKPLEEVNTETAGLLTAMEKEVRGLITPVNPRVV